MTNATLCEQITETFELAFHVNLHVIKEATTFSFPLLSLILTLVVSHNVHWQRFYLKLFAKKQKKHQRIISHQYFT